MDQETPHFRDTTRNKVHKAVPKFAQNPREQPSDCWINLVGARIKLVGTWIEFDGTWIKLDGIWIKLDGSWIKFAGNRIKSDGDWIKLSGKTCSYGSQIGVLCETMAAKRVLVVVKCTPGETVEPKARCQIE